MTTPPEPDVQMPSWYARLHTRVQANPYPDDDLHADLQMCLDYAVRVRRERDRMLNQLTANFERIKAALDLLDRMRREGVISRNTADMIHTAFAAPVEDKP